MSLTIGLSYVFGHRATNISRQTSYCCSRRGYFATDILFPVVVPSMLIPFFASRLSRILNMSSHCVMDDKRPVSRFRSLDYDCLATNMSFTVIMSQMSLVCRVISGHRTMDVTRLAHFFCPSLHGCHATDMSFPVDIEMCRNPLCHGCPSRRSGRHVIRFRSSGHKYFA